MAFSFRKKYICCNEKYPTQGGYMETIVPESIPTRAKNFIVRHKVAVAVSVTTAVCLVLNRVALKQHDEFLESKGLKDEFYNPTED